MGSPQRGKGIINVPGVRMFRWAVVAVVAAAVVVGLIISGSPGRERLRQFDNERVSDLQQITYAVDSYWSYNLRLPQALQELVGKREYYVQSITDPGTGESYEYRAIGEKSYELCAIFETDSKELPAPEYGPRGIPGDFWAHGSGRTCFTIEVRVAPAVAPPKD